MDPWNLRTLYFQKAVLGIRKIMTDPEIQQQKKTINKNLNNVGLE